MGEAKRRKAWVDAGGEDWGLKDYSRKGPVTWSLRHVVRAWEEAKGINLAVHQQLAKLRNPDEAEMQKAIEDAKKAESARQSDVRRAGRMRRFLSVVFRRGG